MEKRKIVTIVIFIFTLTIFNGCLQSDSQKDNIDSDTTELHNSTFTWRYINDSIIENEENMLDIRITNNRTWDIYLDSITLDNISDKTHFVLRSNNSIKLIDLDTVQFARGEPHTLAIECREPLNPNPAMAHTFSNIPDFHTYCYIRFEANGNSGVYRD
jgi:hypothetical protein